MLLKFISSNWEHLFSYHCHCPDHLSHNISSIVNCSDNFVLPFNCNADNGTTMKVFAILLLVCLSATMISGGIVQQAVSLACDGLIPIVGLLLDTIIKTVSDLLNGVLKIVTGLLSSLPVVGGVLGGVLPLGDILTTVTAALDIRTALLGAVCGPAGLLPAVEKALCG
jgi:hypothetical protein